MVLTDREIQVAMHQGQIVIDPAPKPECFSSTSVDLTLSPRIRVWKSEPLEGVEPFVLSPGTAGYRHAPVVERHSEPIELTGEGFVMKPGAFVLGWTSERVELPAHSRLAARVEGRSSLARCAIAVHVTAPTIHSGFAGQIQLEICNIGPLHVRLLPQMSICQLIFEQTLGTPQKGYRGKFIDQDAV